MAIEIIREGKKNFKIECPKCEALLSYSIHDIIGASIRCHCCGEYCQHYNRIKENDKPIVRSCINCANQYTKDCETCISSNNKNSPLYNNPSNWASNESEGEG